MDSTAENVQLNNNTIITNNLLNKNNISNVSPSKSDSENENSLSNSDITIHSDSSNSETSDSIVSSSTSTEHEEETINFILGQNAKDNHAIIDIADENDWWFHLSDLPSAHCIIEKNEIEDDDIIFAYNLIIKNNKNKNKKNLVICYTQIKNIKKTRTLGEVKFKNINLLYKKIIY